MVLAAAAHPDDIEFCFAGTLLLLKQAGCQIHMWSLANGCCGAMDRSREAIASVRWEESCASAAVAGAVAHPPLFDDLDVFYNRESLARVSAVLRSIRPQIVLTHAPGDYMEDHQNVCRLIVTAAFSHGMTNYVSEPAVAPYAEPVRLYHAAPHGLRDGLGNVFQPDFLVDIEPVLESKRQMLACHKSQSQWLAQTQGMNAYLDEMTAMSRAIGSDHSGAPQYAEGWRRHSHLGFCEAGYDPVPSILGDAIHAIAKP